jgi:hypothetical protein
VVVESEKKTTKKEKGRGKRKSNDELIQHYSEIKTENPPSYEIAIRLVLLERDEADSERK